MDTTPISDTTRERRPSVLWVNHFAVSPLEGGGTRHFELGRELVGKGYNITLLASDFNLHSRQYTRRTGGDSRTPVEEKIEGVRFLWVWAPAYTKNNWRRVWNWLGFAKSVAQLDESTPHVIVGSSPHLFAALAGSRLASRYNVPFVLEVRDLWPESMLAVGGSKGVAYYVFDAIAKYLYRRADRIVVLARGTSDHLERMGITAEKICYVPNGVDVDAFSEPAKIVPNAVSFTVVYAGAHGPANGLDTVLDAADLLKEHAHIRIMLVGDGPAKAHLVQRAQDMGLTNVVFRASVPKREMPVLLAQADAGLMVLKDSPLFAFGVSPNKLFDYLGAGLPVICNVPGEVASMLALSGAGEQTVDASSQSLADAILRMAARSSDDRRSLGISGREWVSREHGRPVLADRLDRMFKELTRT